MLCFFISCTILKPIHYHAVPDFNINPTSFMNTEFSEIKLLRNILFMSNNQNQERLINCKKKKTEPLAEKWWVFQAAEASKMPGPILTSTTQDSVQATTWIKNGSNTAFRLRNTATWLGVFTLKSPCIKFAMTTSSYEPHVQTQPAYRQSMRFFASVLDGSCVCVAVRGKFLEEHRISYLSDLSLREEDLVISAAL
jgi:hypothetical protein